MQILNILKIQKFKERRLHKSLRVNIDRIIQNTKQIHKIFDKFLVRIIKLCHRTPKQQQKIPNIR